MPYIHNGIGTWYWGKTNIRTSRGTCQFCRRSTELKSYDTTKFFVVLMVPLVPLGQKRIINQCGACKKHLVLSLKKFTELRDKEAGAAVEEYLRSPGDRAKAEAAIGKAVSFEATDEFLKVAEAVERSLARDPRVQGRLGAAYAFFGMPQQAEAAYVRSLQLAPDDEVRELLAVLYMREGRPDDAAPLLRPILEARQREKIGYVYLLAEAYEAAGRHDDALALLQQVATAFPGIENEAEFARYRTIALRNRVSGKRIKPANLSPVSSRASEHRPWSALLPRLIAPALALLGLAIYLAVAVAEGQSRTVWVVNGLDRPYDVDLNGQRLTLAPFQHRKTSLAEGDVKVTVLDPAMALPPQTCRISTPLLARPVEHHTFVINPDQAAIVVDEQTTYSKYHGPSEKRPYHLHVNELLHSFSNIDYVFQEFPSSIKVSSSAGSVNKERVFAFAGKTPMERMYIVEHEVGDAAVPAYLRSCAIGHPQDPQLIQLAVAMMPPDEALQFVRERLGIHPVLVEWHRVYQELMGRVHPDADLTAEYKARLAADPTDAALAYLLGRTTNDRTEAARLFEQSTKGNSPCAYGYYALAYDAMARADFARALELDRQALALLPDNAQFRDTEQTALLALARYDELLSQLRSRASADPDNVQLIMEQIRVLATQGHTDQARAVAADAQPKGPDVSPDVSRKWQSQVDATIALAQGDLQKAASALLEASDAPATKFEAALCRGSAEDAATALAGQKFDAPETRLLLYIVAASQGRPDSAARSLEQALAALRKGNKDERQMAAYLSTAAPPDATPAIDLVLQPEWKRIFLTAMGLKDPAHRDEYLHAAAKFNFNRDAVYWALKRAAESPAAAASTH